MYCYIFCSLTVHHNFSPFNISVVCKIIVCKKTCKSSFQTQFRAANNNCPGDLITRSQAKDRCEHGLVNTDTDPSIEAVIY